MKTEEEWKKGQILQKRIEKNLEERWSLDISTERGYIRYKFLEGEFGGLIHAQSLFG